MLISLVCVMKDDIWGIMDQICSIRDPPENINIILSSSCGMESECIIIGYYPFRAKAQIARLLCEYLHLSYRDSFFTPDEWNKFREVEGRGWVVKDLPFIKHQGFKLTGHFAIVEYLCELGNRSDMLGKTLQHKMRFDFWCNRIHLKEKLLSKMCSLRPMNCQQRAVCLRGYFQCKVLPILVQHQSECMDDNFYFGYITVMDFVIYELINHVALMFPDAMGRLKKLKRLRDRVAEIPEIKEYQSSSRAVSDYCPITFFQKYRQEKIKACKSMQSGSGGSGCKTQDCMDLE